MAKFKNKKLTNPLIHIAAKIKIQKEEVDKISLLVLIALDAAKKSKAPHPLADTLARHLLTSVLLWSKMGNRAMYDMAVDGWNALQKACLRPTELLDLSTQEYQKIRKAISYYLKALPNLETGVLVGAFAHAEEKLAANFK